MGTIIEAAATATESSLGAVQLAGTAARFCLKRAGRAPDELGLLHRVTRALFDCDLNVVSARVSTIG